MNREHAPYFFIAPSSFSDPVLIEGDDAKHLVTVRRALPGDRIVVSDGCGEVAELFLDAVDRTRVAGHIIRKWSVPRPSPTLTIIQAVTKVAKLELIIQKLVEVGVDRVCVVTSDRSVVRPKGDRRDKAAERLTSIGLEAAKQSHRAWLPQIIGPDGFERALAEMATSQLSMVAQPGAERSMTETLAQEAESVAVAVGPEGGWSSEEISRFTQAGAKAFSLGDQILRAETASMAIAALAMHRMGRLG